MYSFRILSLFLSLLTCALSMGQSEQHEVALSKLSSGASQRHRRLLSEYVIYNQQVYALLTHLNPDGTDMLCQSNQVFNYLPVEYGFVLAPDDANSVAVIQAHKWSTNSVVVASGVSYKTLTGEYYASGQLLTSSNMYSVASCPQQILQV